MIVIQRLFIVCWRLPREPLKDSVHPFFYSPEKDARIAPLDALSDKPPVYRAFTWREYIQGRIDDNFTDLGEEDIQIAHYKVGKSGGAS